MRGRDSAWAEAFLRFFALGFGLRWVGVEQMGLKNKVLVMGLYSVGVQRCNPCPQFRV
jgi:hypothetical protein